MISEGAEIAHSNIKSWNYSDFLFVGSKSLFQTEKQLLNFSIGVGPAIVIKPKEYYEGTYNNGINEYTWTYDQHVSTTISSNAGVNYSVKLAGNFCLTASVDYSYVPFSTPYKSITANADNPVTTNGEEVTGGFATEASPNKYTIQGLSTGLKLGFSF